MWALLATMSAHTFPRGGTAVGAAHLVDTDLYAVLDVSPSASASAIRVAYRRAVLSAHPDKGGSCERFHSITSAFNIISCPASRNLYDQHQLQASKQPHLGKRSGKPEFDSDPQNDTPYSDARADALAGMNQSLQRLRDVLQAMRKPVRQALMSSIPMHVQKALKDFMETTSKKTPPSAASDGHPRRAGSACTRLSTSGNKSKAQLDIEHLRIYTRWVDLEVAIEHQVMLVEVKDSIAAASVSDSNFWSVPDKVIKAFEHVLSNEGTSIEELGLSVYVEMRATEWVASGYHITSPVLTLVEAIALRSRLIFARSTSWDLVRSEWINLLQRGRHGRSLEEAEAYVDQARQSFLERQLSHAVGSVERALATQHRIESKIKSRTERKSSRAQKAARVL